MTPLCVVAHEMRSGRTVSLWQTSSARSHRTGSTPMRWSSAILISAEFGCHIALGWGEPACSLDPYVEFRHHTNDGAHQERRSRKGLLQPRRRAALFLARTGSTPRTKTICAIGSCRVRRSAADEREAILTYCEDDVRALAAPGAAHRAHHPLAAARHGARASSCGRRHSKSVAAFRSICRCLSGPAARWDDIRSDLVTAVDHFGIYEIEDGTAALV